MMTIIDITLPIAKGALFIGQKLPSIAYRKEMKLGDACNMSYIDGLDSHMWTHIDFPFHMIKNGKRSEAYAIEKYCGICFVADISDGSDLLTILKKNDLKNKILLIKTQKKRRILDRDYYALSVKDVRFIVQRWIKSIWIDTLSIDGYGKKDFYNHKAFLKKDILIYEGLDLKNVDMGDYFFVWVPIKIAWLEATPSRCMLFTL